MEKQRTKTTLIQRSQNKNTTTNEKMNDAAGQQRLTAFYDKQENEGKGMKDKKKGEKGKATESIGDQKQESTAEKMEWTLQVKEEATDNEEEEVQGEDARTKKRQGEKDGSPKKKQKQQGNKRQTNVEKEQKKKKRNTPSKKQKGRSDTQEEDESTPERNNHAKYRHVHTSRITLKLTVQGQKDMKAGMMRLFKEYLIEMRKADPNLQIYLWREGDDRTKPRIKSENDLTDIAAMQAAYGKNFFV